MIEAIKVVKTKDRAVQIIDEFRAVNLLDLTTKVGLVRRDCKCGCSNAYCAVWYNDYAQAMIGICPNCGDDNAVKEEVLMGIIENKHRVYASIEINEEDAIPTSFSEQARKRLLATYIHPPHTHKAANDFKIPEDVAFGRIKKIVKAATKKVELVRAERDQALTSKWQELEKKQREAKVEILMIKAEGKKQIDNTLDLIDELYNWANRLFIAVFVLLGLAALASVVFVGAYHQLINVAFCVVMVLVLLYQGDRDKQDSL